MKTLVVELNEPSASYDDLLDGHRTQEFLQILGIDAELCVAQTKARMFEALKQAGAGRFDVLHLSYYGDGQQLTLADGTPLSWHDCAAQLQHCVLVPPAIVIPSCCGDDSEIGVAFERRRVRPGLIFGSVTGRHCQDYLVAWDILYRQFMNEGVTTAAAQRAIAEISVAAYPTFRLRSWDDRTQRYVV